MSRDLYVTSPMMTGQDVRELQTRLTSLGYSPGDLDGEYGPLTAEAVRAFQRDHQLEVDGIAGPITLGALAAVGSKGSPPRALPRPCSASEAVARALSIARNGGQYELGTGDYRPTSVGGKLVDAPWTSSSHGAIGSDCAGFAISWCYKVPRHRPGLNVGPWSTCADDLNCNSAIEDSDHAQDLFVRATGTLKPGDLIAYRPSPCRTIQIPGSGMWLS
jgi:hypothetical protein